MKIEKINENQIRCTLTGEDLASRKIRISELAYGTEKAKNLFRDMMQQANQEFGFEADNIPLMIEAIPISQDGIILIITKVEDPEELDTRFSKFAPTPDDMPIENSEEISFSGADDIIDIFQKLYESKTNANKHPSSEKKSEDSQKDTSQNPVNLIRMYQYDTLDSVIQSATVLGQYFDGENSLYKNSQTHKYSLVLHQANTSPEAFNRVCNILSEYASGNNYSQASEAHLIEHSEIILSKNALQELAIL